MNWKPLVLAAFILGGVETRSDARYYDAQVGRFISPDPIVDDVSDPQAFNRYAYVRNNPISYSDPLGLWRINASFHSVFGGSIAYDSKTGDLRAGVGVGRGAGVSVGNSNWDVGYSNDNYLDVGYDKNASSVYAQGHAGEGFQGPGGVAHGYGAGGSYYARQNDYVVDAGVGYFGFGINGGYSSFGNGGIHVGGSIGQIGATYDFGSNSWSYSYTVYPKALQDAYNDAKKARSRNGYGPEGCEKYFFIIDWVGTVVSGWIPSDKHDIAYHAENTKRASADLDLFKGMIRGALSNTFKPNGLLRAAVGLAVSPFYYGAVRVGGGGMFRENHEHHEE